MACNTANGCPNSARWRSAGKRTSCC